MFRYSEHRELVARFDSKGDCGHPIKKGDVIGYAARGGKPHRKTHTCCAGCWSRWVEENREADLYEESLPGFSFSHGPDY